MKKNTLKKAKRLLFVFAFLFNLTIVSAQTAVTPAGNAAGLCVGDGYITLDDIYIKESDPEDFAAGDNQTYIATLPAGFEFEPGQGQVNPYPAQGDFTALAITVAKNFFTLTYHLAAGNASTDGFVITGLKIKATAEANGDLLRTGGNAAQKGNGLGDAQSMAALKSFSPPTAVLTSDKTDNRICEGSEIVFTAKESAGSRYAFYVNGVEKEGLSSKNTFGSDALENGDKVSVIVENVNGCRASSSDIIVLVDPKPDPDIFGLDEEYCANKGPVEIEGYPRPSSSASGTFSGPGITDLGNGNAKFNPAAVEPDKYITVTYTFTSNKGCTQSWSQQVWVYSVPTITLGERIKVSFKDDDSKNYFIDGEIVSEEPGKGSSPEGGEYSGMGVNGGFFNPAAAGIGIHSIFYTYTDPDTECAVQDFFKVEVFDIEQGQITGLTENSYCENNAIIELQGVPSLGGAPGGIISGQGIVSSDKTTGKARFDPKGLGGRNVTLKYVFKNKLGLADSVSKTVEVLKVPDVSFAGDGLAASYCTDFEESKAQTVSLRGPSGSAGGKVSFHGFGIQPDGDTDYRFSTYAALNDYMFAYARDTVQSPKDVLDYIGEGYLDLGIDDDFFYLKNLSKEDFVYEYSLLVSFEELDYYYKDFMHLFAELDKLKDSPKFEFDLLKYAVSQGCANQTQKTVTLFLPPKAIRIDGIETAYCLNAPADTLQGFPAGGRFEGIGITNLGGGKAVFVADSARRSPRYDILVSYSYTGPGGCVSKTSDSVHINGGIPDEASFSVSVPRSGGGGPSTVESPRKNDASKPFEICSSSDKATLVVILLDEKKRPIINPKLNFRGNPWAITYDGKEQNYVFKPNSVTFTKDSTLRLWLDTEDAAGKCKVSFPLDLKISLPPAVKITPQQTLICLGTDKLRFTVSPYSANDQVKLFKAGVTGEGGPPDAEASATAKDSVISLSTLAAGKYHLVYFYRDATKVCPGDATTLIEITAPTAMAFPETPANVCTNAPDYFLESKEFKEGGFFSTIDTVTGIKGGVENLGNGKARVVPSKIQPGKYKIFYNYTDLKGCKGTVEKEVTFYAPLKPRLRVGPTVGVAKFCLDAGLQIVATGTTEVDAKRDSIGRGVFSVLTDQKGWEDWFTKTENGNGVFNLAKAGVGAHRLVYSYTSFIPGTKQPLCSLADTLSAEVFQVPKVSLTIKDTVVCNNQLGEIKLIGIATLGTEILCQNGSGIYTVTDPTDTLKSSGDTFTPFGKKKGIYRITFSCSKQYAGLTCSSIAVKTIEVKDPPVLEIIGLDKNYCENSLPDTITANIFNAGAKFSGNGIKNLSPGKALFTPADANEDEGNFITYSYTNGIGCVTTRTDSVYVTSTPKPAFGIFDAAGKQVDNNDVTCVTGSSLVVKDLSNAKDAAGKPVFGVYVFGGTMKAKRFPTDSLTTNFNLRDSTIFSPTGRNNMPILNTKMDSIVDEVLGADYYFVEAEMKITYSLSVNGCEASINKTIKIKGLPVLDLKITPAGSNAILAQNASICGADNETYRITSNVYGQTGTWVLKQDGKARSKSTPTANTLDFSFKADTLAVGRRLFTYEFTLTEGGCLNIGSFYINILPLPKAEIITLNACGSTTASFEGKLTDASVSAGIKPKSWFWTFPNAEPTTSSVQNPSNIIFKEPGSYEVSLTVKAENGCSYTFTDKNIQVGTVPDPKFSWANTCFGEALQFTDNTVFNNANESIAKWQWDFGDGTPVSTIKNPSHVYAKYGSYNVTLSLASSNNCTGALSQTVHIYPSVEVKHDKPYNSSFATGRKGWVGQGTNSSWSFGIDAGFSAAAGDSIWATGLNAKFNDNENSWVESPCFNLDSLEKPMVSMNIHLKFGTQSDLHGAVLMASTDGGGKWEIVGASGKGINWYKNNNILSNPGEDPANNIGWSGDGSGKWMNVRYGLDKYKGQSSVRFRIKFASKANPLSLKGFAFKDFTVKERDKGVLLEHFTNAANAANTASYSQSVFDAYQKDIVPILYHTDYPGPDPLNASNPADPSGRALYYGVLETPRSVLDGKAYNGIADKWTAVTVDSLTLKSPSFDIALVFDKTKGNIKAAITSRIAVTDPIALRLAIIENPVGTDKYVLRRMLPDAAGHIFRTAGLWKAGDIASADFPWLKFVSQNPSNVGLVAFVQNEKTREIYQSIYKAPQELTGLITALEDGVGVSWLQLYPNPAEDNFTVSLGEGAKNGFSWEVYSATGAKLMSGETRENNCKVEVGTLPSGVYLIKVDAGENTSAVKRFVVKH